MKKGMYVVVLTAALTVLCCVSNVTTDAHKQAQKPYEIKIIPESSDVDIQRNDLLDNINPYYIAHHFALDLFIRQGIDFGRNDQLQIIYNIAQFLNEDTKIHIHIKDFKDMGRLEYYIGYLEKNGKRSVLVTSNYDVTKQRLLRDGENPRNTYAVIYYIIGDKLVRYDQVHNDEVFQAHADNNNNIADMYLFDERPENDESIEGLLLKDLQNDSLGDNHVLIAWVTLAQYYTLKGEQNKAATAVDKARELSTKENIHKINVDFVTYTSREMYITEILEDKIP